MAQPARGRALRYGVAILFVASALAATLATSLRSGAPFLLPLTAVILGTWYGGRRPGLLASLIAGLGSLYFIIEPTGTLAADNLDDILRIGVFGAATLILTQIAAQRDRARDNAHCHALQQRAIAELGHRALVDTDLETLLREATGMVREVLGVEYSNVLELLPDGESLLVRTASGWTESQDGRVTIPAGTGSQGGYTLLSNEPVISCDLRRELRFRPPAFLLEQNIISAMTVVIHGAQTPFGVLGALSTRKRKFSPDDVHFLQTIANSLATAIRHHQAEQELRHTHQLLESMFSSIEFSIVYMDRDLKYIRVNRAYAQDAGHIPDFYPGRSHFELYPDPEYESLCRRVLETGESQVLAEKPFHNPDHPERGTTFWDSSIQPVKDSGGEVTGLVVSAVNVTERVKAQERLREASEQLRQVVNYAPLGLWSMDREGRFTLMEGSLPRHMGIVPEEIFGQSLIELLPDRPDIHAEVRHALTGQEFATEFNVAGRILQTHVWPARNAAGELTGVRGLTFDVTDQKRAEEQVRDVAREMVLLQEDDRHQISHELNDNLGQVLAAVKMSFEAVQADLPVDTPALYRRVGAAVYQLSDIIVQIRSLAQLLRPAALDTVGLHTTLQNLCKNVAQDACIQVDYEGIETGELPAVVSISLFRLAQEVMDNALRHAQATHIDVQLARADGELELSIAYNGHGFDPEADLAHPRRRGTGLGSMQERLRLLGGSLDIQSGPDHTELAARLPVPETVTTPVL